MNTEPELHLLVDRKQIATAVEKLAAEIREDYHDRNPLLVGVLKGSFIFLADLVRELDIPLEVDFIRLASYGSGTKTSGQITLVHDLGTGILGRHVLIVEDIVDSGLSVAFLRDHLLEEGPASLKICALADKPSGRKVPVKIDYTGLTLPDKFIVGYGTDCNEQYRHLPDIYYINSPT